MEQFGNSEKKHITILIGAGAVIEATGGVSTNYLTKRVIQECKGYRISSNKGQSIVDSICKAYWERFGKDDPDYKPYSKARLDVVLKYVNFEDIFHVVELLEGYTINSYLKRYTSAYKIFTLLKSKYRSVDYISIKSTARKIIDVINSEVENYSEQFESRSAYFRDFLQSLEEKYTLNIFNLNYDDWCEKSLKNCEDGFESITGYNHFKRFSIKKYRKTCCTNVNTVAQLHGSILFEGPDLTPSDINRFAYCDDRACLYKYTAYNKAADYRMRTYSSNLNNQAGESLIPSNVITGLMKTDKLLSNPLMEYEHHFYQSVTSNNNLIIVGYGFSDIYINSILWKFRSDNDKNRKVMLITKASEEDWQPWIEPPLNPKSKTNFSFLMFKDEGWYRKFNLDDANKGAFSEDHMAAIYTCGLKSVVDNYMRTVIDFFN